MADNSNPPHARRTGPLPKAPRPTTPVVSVDRAAEEEVGISVNDLAAVYVLDSLRGFGPQKFKELHLLGLRPAQVASERRRFPFAGKTGDDLRSKLAQVTPQTRAECAIRAARQILAAQKQGGKILTYGHPFYPRNVLDSNYPMPVLYVRGALEVLRNRCAVACVGSRKIRAPYDKLHSAFARQVCGMNGVVVSGFALGADTIGHEAALKAEGQTVCVMPSGLDRPFPPENRSLWESLLKYSGAVFVSEFAFGTAASALTLRKRNKGIVAFALGVLVSQSSDKGGAMNAYRFALEQRKQVVTFAHDDTGDTSGNRAIAEDQRTCAVVLPHGSPDTQAQERWLRQLFSSI